MKFLVQKNNIKIKLNPIKQDKIEETSFNEQEASIIVPCKKPEKFKEIVKIMEDWCRKTHNSSNMKR